MNSPIPDNEKARYAALCGYQILDSGPEVAFDTLTRLAAHICGTPISVVSLIDANRQWFKSRIGLDATETSRDVAFCAHALMQPDIFIIPDALADERFAANPLVTSAPFVRFYAGVPLITPDGYALGTLCVIDHVPRHLRADQQDALRILAQEVMAQLELRRKNKELEPMRDRVELILNTAEEGILGLDADGNISFANPAAAHLTGWEAGEMLGKCVHELLHHSYPDGTPYPAAACPMLNAYKGGYKQSMAGEMFWRKNGTSFYVQATSSPMIQTGQYVGTVLVFQDISASIEATQALQRAADELESRVDQRTAELSRVNDALLKEIAERTHTQKVLHDSETRTRAIVDNVAQGIITVNEDWIIESFNPMAAKIFGYSSAEVLGKHIRMLIPAPVHGEDSGNHLAINVADIVGKPPVVLHGRHKDGTIFPLELSVNEIYLDRQRRFVGIMQDITERKEIERMKNEFISTVSHELRTPLTSIRGALGLIKGGVAGRVSAQAQSLIDIAYKNSERLVRLINDILDIEKIESGKMEIRLEPLQLIEIVEQAIGANQSYADQFGVKFFLHDNAPQAHVNADSDRLMQVLTNLLSNAAKFSPAHGTVNVSIMRHAGCIRVSVIDQGPGIPEEFHARIFQRFAQADASDTRQKGGTGLGLNIVKAIIDRLAGQIAFTSIPHVATTFYFDLPEWDKLKQTA